MAGKTSLVATRWGDPFTDKEGRPLRRPQAWIDEVTRILGNEVTNSNALVPNFVSIDATDSPYAAKNSDYIIANMSLGPVNVTMPSAGRVSVSRSGVPNALTLIGTVNGEVNPEILFDGSCATMAFITEWRYV